MGKVGQFVRCVDGAVAPTVALALVGLVAVGGIAFDYARMVGMHTELQNAADQAALAAVTQLDGSSGSRTRADAAARTLVANLTRISNDNAGRPVGIASVVFYLNKTKTLATSDANARFVEVTVNGRRVNYALTPIVSLLSSGDINAKAMAGMGSATCKTPPVMICNPAESTDPTFTVSNYIGKGLKLVSVGNGGGAWAPGNFGYLDTNGGSNGAPGLREALGWQNVPGDCVAGAAVDTKPGASVTVTDALNTRFDIYEPGQSCPNGGTCPPSANSVKDVIKTDGVNGNACTIHNSGWQIGGSPYLPATTSPLSSGYPTTMGHPRDICHAVDASATGACTGTVGNGTWDVDAYFRVNYNVDHATWVSALATGSFPVTASGSTAPFGVTRYQVYRWEMANAGTTLGSQVVLGPRTVTGGLKSRGAPYCSTPGVTPSGSTPDRRRMALAVINCTANNVNGNSTNVPVQKWLDVFLVEPSINRARTSAGDVYVEVIAQAASSSDGTVGQVVHRDVPYLIE